MTMTVDNIVKLLGDTQLKYRRLHFGDYTQELAPRPVTVCNRIGLPSFFQSLFDDGMNLSVQSVSGKKFSFWHSLLHCIYPNYIELSWYDRKALVDRFIDELNHDVQSYFQRDELISKTNMQSEDVRFHDQLSSNELIYYLSSKFKINIILCDTTRIYFYFPGLSFQSEMPTIMLFRDDSPIYHVITVDDKTIAGAHDGLIMANLYATVPEVNRVLSNHTSKSDTSLYSKVNKLTPEQSFKTEAQPKLNTMKLAELQVLAQKYGLSIEKEGKSKMVKKLKKELVEDIVSHLSCTLSQ
jgi:hypothetical protein